MHSKTEGFNPPPTPPLVPHETTLGFLIHGLWAEIVDVQNLGGPGGPKNNSKRVGAKPSTFWNGFWGPPGPPRAKKSTISGRPKNHVFKTQVHARS